MVWEVVAGLTIGVGRALTPTLSQGERGCSSASGRLHSTLRLRFGAGPHPNPLPGGEGVVWRGREAAFHAFRIGTGGKRCAIFYDTAAIWGGPSPQPSPRGRGVFWREREAALHAFGIGTAL